MTALFIGRFQPFHNGHLNALEQIFEREQKIIIGIGSSNVDSRNMMNNLISENPYTAEKRAELITSALSRFPKYAGRYTIVFIPDINNNAAWPAYVESLLPPFGPVYTGSALTKALFKQYSSHPVIDLKKNIDVSATEVRLEMVENGNWQTLVPPPVAELLLKWNK